jgi:hypothetical protein
LQDFKCYWLALLLLHLRSGRPGKTLVPIGLLGNYSGPNMGPIRFLYIILEQVLGSEDYFLRRWLPFFIFRPSGLEKFGHCAKKEAGGG